jgi:hypothetical protein
MSLPTVEPLETRRVYSASATTVREMLGEGASLSDANYLGTFNTRTSRSATTWLGGMDGDQVLYEVDVNAPVMLTAKLSNLRQNVLTQLLFSDGTPITYASNPNSKTELITQRLDPGTYYLNLMTNSNTSSRLKMSVKSSKAPFGSVAPQQPDDILDVKSGFTLNVPFGANPTPSTPTPDYVGTIPDGISPNPDEDLHYQGGYTIPDLNFANLYVGSNPD